MTPPAAAAAAPEPNPSPTPSGAVQLLLRNIDSRTIVVRPQREDTLDSVLERLGKAAALRGDLRVEYGGRCLPGEATIGELGLPPDATLHVTSRLLSTPHPDAWNLAAEVAAAAGRPASAKSLDRIVTKFLNSARNKKAYSGPLGAVADHMVIFLRSGAPVVLAQLYLSSSDAACRASAESAIQRFLVPDLLDDHSRIKAWTAPVLVEFSRYFAAAAHQADPLYANLRSRLAAVLCDPGWNPECWLNFPPERLAEQLIRFAVEKASSVIEHIAGAHLLQAADKKNLSEFKVFSSALRRHVPRLNTNAPRRPWWTALYQRLVSLLRCVDEYMDTVENFLRQRPHSAFTSSSTPLNWTAKLPCAWVVLDEVDAWAAMDGWPELRHALRATLGAHPAATRALAMSAGTEWCENTGWVARHRDLLDFEARRHLAVTALPRLADDDSDAPHEMLIDRAQLLVDSFGYVAHEAPEKLRAGLWVEFMHEQATGPGARREWFSMVFQALFNPHQVLFSACPSDRRRFFVNPGELASHGHDKIALHLCFLLQA
jgi:hypothetical protein